MQKIDSHQHFWLFDPIKDSWITEDMAAIKRDFLPAELHDIFLQNNIYGCIAVQSRQEEEDNIFLLGLAKDNPFIKGIVGWIDLSAGNVEQRLQYYRQFEKIKGFRHNLEAKADLHFMMDNHFMSGLSLLHQYGFTYDLLIRPKHLKIANRLVRSFPKQRFVIDHLAKPSIKAGELSDWQADINLIAKNQNVFCKISGFCAEADWDNWNLGDIRPYLDCVFTAFGKGRVMYGSDWPVCNIAGGYNRSLEALKAYVSDLPVPEQELFWGINAMDFYSINQ